MKRLGWLAVLFWLVPATAMAYSLSVNGTNVNIDEGSVSVDSPEGKVNISGDQVTVSGENGSATVSGDSLTVNANGVGMGVVTDESGMVVINGTGGNDVGATSGMGAEGWGFYTETEAEAANTRLAWVRIEGENMVVAENGRECILNVGLQAVQTVCPNNSVVVYYSDSGVEGSDAQIGDKSKGIYLKTAFGQVKVNALPNQIYEDLAKESGNKLDRVEFGWDSAGRQLRYEFQINKSVKILGLIPISVVLEENFDVANGKKINQELSWWNQMIEWLS